jgi:hypothetical protein
VQIGHRKHLRRKSNDGKKCRSRKLLNALQPYESGLLAEMKPVSVTLERLDQSILEKYSPSISSVTSRAKQQTSVEFLSQEMIGAGNSGVSIGSREDWNDRGKLKRICYDKIPCLDGVFEGSSSDDCSESRNTDHFSQLEKSPVTKKTRWTEGMIKKDENNLPDQNHENAGCSDSTSLLGTPPKEAHVGPAKNLNTFSPCETCGTVQSPRKSVYPPLAIKIQKSPKKRNVNTEGKFHERYPHNLERSNSLKCLSVYSNSNRSSKMEQSSRLSGEEGIETRPKCVAVKQKFTNDQAHEYPKGMCDFLKKRKRKSSILRSRRKCVDTATKLTITPSGVCHDVGARDDQQDTCTEKHRYVLSLKVTCLLL